MAVSVVLTCHNEERFIAKAIESIVEQTLYDEVDKIIVVNDGSVDRSQDVLECLAKKVKKLEVIQSKGIGVSAARNLAIEAATGEFVAFLDGDDFWVPEKLKRQMPAFKVSPKVGLVYSDFYDFTQDDLSDLQLIPVRRYRVSRELPLFDYFVQDGPVIPSTMIVRRSVFEELGLFDPRLRIGEDTDMCLRIAQFWYFQHVPGGLACKRRHGMNASGNLDQWDPAAERVSELMIARVPELARLRRKRASYRRSKIASAYFAQGANTAGWRYLIAALRGDIFNFRAYAIVAMAMLPVSARRAVVSWIRRVRALISGWIGLRGTDKVSV
ncbi:MAG: glycosyltransferase family 2 protein [Parvibaculum sp.]|nr:glycosyltransferase family 2 protein [Parvibaculum sp.]